MGVQPQQIVTAPISAKSLGGSSTIRHGNHETDLPPDTTIQSERTATGTPPQVVVTSVASPSSPSKSRNTTVTSNTADVTTTASPTSDPTSNNKSNNNVQYEYNPRWKGYMYIVLASLLNLASICNVARNEYTDRNDTNSNITNRNFSSSSGSVLHLANGSRGVALSFSIVTFVFSFSVVITDRLQILTNKFHYMKLYNGNVEGISLLIGTLYAIVAVAYMTQVRGIAFLTLNIYFSVWLILISFIYTLNKWSSAKDILSINELTGVSATLKSWYVVLISSMVVVGTSINMLVVLSNYQSAEFDESDNARAATLGIVFGFCSTIIALWMILSHYNFIECTNEGGWFELLLIIIIIFIWIIATAVLTANNSIAATITGSGCSYTPAEECPSLPSTIQEIKVLIRDVRQHRANETDNNSEECYLQIYNTTFSCDIFSDDDDDDNIENNSENNSNSVETIPGSNLYVFLWMNLLASFHLISRWKAQQALQFAQTQQQQSQQKNTSVNIAEKNVKNKVGYNDNSNNAGNKNSPRNHLGHHDNAFHEDDDDNDLANVNNESDDDDLDAYDDDDRY